MPHQNEWQWYVIISLPFHSFNPRWGSAALGNIGLILTLRVLGKSLSHSRGGLFFPDTFLQAETGSIFCPAFPVWLSWCGLMRGMLFDSCTLNRIHCFFHLLLLLAPRRLKMPFRRERECRPCQLWRICGTLSGRLGALGFLFVSAALLDVLNICDVNSLLEGSPSSTGYTWILGRLRLASVLKTCVPLGIYILVLVTASKQH